MKNHSLRELVQSRIRALRSKSFMEVSRLPSYQDERLKFGRARVTLAIWMESLDENHRKIVVQAYRHLFLGIGRMEAEGFVIDQSGHTRDLRRDELYDFT